MSGCATVFGGRVSETQKRKPLPGEPKRKIRAGALVADILLFPLASIPVDFATGAIYQPKPAVIDKPSATQPVKAGNGTQK
ncbi:MAG: hypothetical protein H7Z75_21155 [Ferruginibacter sp.]|nr:hypothetical protein [Cytophagales bacterium]